ncbi:MAG: dihydroxyacetone kinase subunit L [Opitutales bacterium]|nr:dihydroxyacetone kinase subunit L [Opitutales bacterium]
MSISLSKLSGVVAALNDTIQENKAYLSEVDGAIGDGDHGINMAKGFAIAADATADGSKTVSEELSVLSKTLMMKIGGSMGPLYGMFFKAMADTLKDRESMDLETFSGMISAAKDAISKISPAKPGDKTLMDCLVPSVESLVASVSAGDTLDAALEKMKKIAAEGRDSTKDMVAKLGRSSRLGERSRGVLDAGSCSCYLILETLANQVIAAE